MKQKDTLRFFEITTTDIFKWIIIAIIVMAIFLAICAKIYISLEKYRNMRNKLDQRDGEVGQHTADIKSITDAISLNAEILEGFREVLIEIMHDTISQKCRFYLSKECIPDDEYDDFTRKWDLYSGVLKGNHGLSVRYNKAKVLPLESEYLSNNKQNQTVN